MRRPRPLHNPVTQNAVGDSTKKEKKPTIALTSVAAAMNTAVTSASEQTPQALPVIETTTLQRVLRSLFFKAPAPPTPSTLYSIRFCGFRFGYEERENDARLFTFLDTDDAEKPPGTPQQVVKRLNRIIDWCSNQQTRTTSKILPTAGNREEISIHFNTRHLSRTGLIREIGKAFEASVTLRELCEIDEPQRVSESQPAAELTNQSIRMNNLSFFPL